MQLFSFNIIFCKFYLSTKEGKMRWNLTPKYKFKFPCLVLPWYDCLKLFNVHCVSNIKDVTSVKMFPTALQQYKFSRTPPVYDLLLCKAFLKFPRNTFKPSNFTHLQLFTFIIKYWIRTDFKVVSRFILFSVHPDRKDVYFDIDK